MPRFLSLISFTDQGDRELKATIDRSNQFRSSVEQAGGKVEGLYWALGAFDGAVVFEAPSEETAVRLLLALDRQGNVRTQTLRVFDAGEFQQILDGV